MGWDALQTSQSPSEYPTRHALGHFVDPEMSPVIISHDGSAPCFLAGASFSVEG